MPTAITHDPVFTTPVSSTNTAVVRWSGTAGSTLQDCGVLIDGSNNLIIPAQGDLRLSDTSGGQYVAFQANGTTTTHTLTFPAAQGSASTVLTNDGAGALTWAAVSSAITREGGNATEATTTSTSAVDLLSATSLTIAALEPFYFVCSGRKTTGAASAIGLGLKLNTTVVGEAIAGSTNRGWGSSGSNRAEDGGYFIFFQPRVTNYVRSTVGRGHVSYSSGDTGTNTSAAAITVTAALPTAEITAVVIRADSATSITTGADELHVYSRAAS